MAGEIIEHEGPESRELVEHQRESSGFLQAIVELANKPTTQPGMIKELADVAMLLRHEEQKQQFNQDMIAAIAEMPVITKAGRIVIADKNTGAIIQSTPYERFEDLDRVVKPIARRHNIQYRFDLGGDKERLLGTIILLHSNGYTERSSPMPMPLETSGSKNNVQGVGSTNSYAKRYLLKNAFAISVEGEDDDGAGGKVLMPQERGNLVIEEATLAHDEGRYDEWYWAQSPKDRAWLVSSGKHAGFGGPALPAPDTTPPPSAPAPTPTPTAKPDGPTPEQQRVNWVATYVGKVEKAPSLEALAALQVEQKANLDRFRDGYPDLWERIEAAHTAATERLSVPPRDGLFDDQAAD